MHHLKYTICINIIINLRIIVMFILIKLDHTEMGGQKKGAATKTSLGGVAPRRSKHTFSDQNFIIMTKNVDGDDNDDDDGDDKYDFCTGMGGVGERWGQNNKR